MIVTSEKVKFVLLEGTLRYEKINEYYNVEKNSYDYSRTPCGSTMVDYEDYPLCEVLPETLKIIRNSGQPGFVLKKDGKLFCATHPHLRRYQGKRDGIKGDCIHRCNEKDMICHRLIALPDYKGGCNKVLDKNSGIEDYDFITNGYEFFNINQDVFVVTECQHWLPSYNSGKSPKLTQEETTKRKLALAQYFWPEVKNIRDLKRKFASKR